MIRGEKFIILLILAGAFYPSLWSTIVAGMAGLALLMIGGSGRFPELKKPWFWIFFLMLFLLPVFLVLLKAGVSEITREDFYPGLKIAARGMAVYAAIMILTSRMDPWKTHESLQPYLGKKLTLSLSMAFNLVPLLRRLMMRQYGVMVLRGGFRRKVGRNFFLLSGSILLQATIISEKTADALYLISRPEKKNGDSLHTAPAGSNKEKPSKY